MRSRKKQQVILNKISREEFCAKNDEVDEIMDEETYVNMNGHGFRYEYYFDSGILPVDEEVKFKEKTKFPEKLLIWLAISRRSRSEVYFRHQKEGSSTGQVYRENCIKKRLIPFIKKYYPHNKYIFGLTGILPLRGISFRTLCSRKSQHSCETQKPSKRFSTQTYWDFLGWS